MSRYLVTILLSLGLTGLAGAEENSTMKEVEALRKQGYKVKSIVPVFSQLILMSQPEGFVPAYENTRGIQYVRELVKAGETTKNWTEMITLSGTKGLAEVAKATPQILVTRIAAGFQRDCPNSYNDVVLGAIKLDGHDAFGAVVGCGVALPTGAPYSEAALIIAIKGSNDFYTIQWAERGPESRTPIKLDDAKWASRLNQLAPIKLCPIVPGEEAPYPSCANRQ